MVAAVALCFLFFSTSVVPSQTENNQLTKEEFWNNIDQYIDQFTENQLRNYFEGFVLYGAEIRNHDTGELIGDTRTNPPIVQHENKFKTQPFFGIGWDQDSMVGWNTTSWALKIEVDIDDKKIYVQAIGPKGTDGKFALFLTPNLVSKPEDISVFLDNQLISFAIEVAPYTMPAGGTMGPSVNDPEHIATEWIVVYAEYSHSVRSLMFSFGASVPEGVPLQTILLVSLIITIGFAVVYSLHKFKHI